MYIKAIIKNRNGEKFKIHVKNKCNIILPNGYIEQFKHSIATSRLLASFYRKMRKYANQNYCIEKIYTDNALIADRFQKEDVKVEFSFTEMVETEA